MRTWCPMFFICSCDHPLDILKDPGHTGVYIAVSSIQWILFHTLSSVILVPSTDLNELWFVCVVWYRSCKTLWMSPIGISVVIVPCCPTAQQLPPLHISSIEHITTPTPKKQEQSISMLTSHASRIQTIVWKLHLTTDKQLTETWFNWDKQKQQQLQKSFDACSRKWINQVQNKGSRSGLGFRV